jgi:hypothetical protein
MLMKNGDAFKWQPMNVITIFQLLKKWNGLVKKVAVIQEKKSLNL